MARNPIVKLQPIARDHHGIVSHAQAATVGVSRDDIHRLIKQRAAVRVHRGVCRLASAPTTFESRAMAAVLAGGKDAVLSHSWAARLWGLTRTPATEQPEIIRPGTDPARIPGVIVHTSRELDRCDVTASRGIPVTSGARTAIDLCHDRLDVAGTMAVVDDLIGLGATSRKWLYLRACHLVKGRSGVQVIARITEPGAEEEFRSWLERFFDKAVVVAFDLPRPAYNVAIHDEHGRIGIADAVWQMRREVVTEVDGLGFHHLAEDRRRDSKKTNRYALSSRIPLRFTYEDVLRAPADVAHQIRQALDAAQR